MNYKKLKKVKKKFDQQILIVSTDDHQYKVREHIGIILKVIEDRKRTELDLEKCPAKNVDTLCCHQSNRINFTFFSSNQFEKKNHYGESIESRSCDKRYFRVYIEM